MLMHQLVLDGAERHPDPPALRWVHRDRGLSYAEAVDTMERMASALAELGVANGDRVTVCGPAIRLVAELPMTPTGKIAKSELLAREASR